MTYEPLEKESLLIRPGVSQPSRIITVAYCSFFVVLAIAAVLLMMADPMTAY